MGAKVIILANPYTYNFVKGLTHSALDPSWYPRGPFGDCLGPFEDPSYWNHLATRWAYLEPYLLTLHRRVYNTQTYMSAWIDGSISEH